MPNFQDQTRFRELDGPAAATGFIPVTLASLREVNSNDIPVMSDSPLTNDPAGFGGLLCKNTTPILEYKNGDTDSCFRVRWAASNVDKVAFSTTLPGDIDFSQPVYIKFIGAMGGATDTPTVTAEVFFGIGDTKVSAASGAVTGTTEAVYTITITAANLESAVAKRFAAVEFTVGSHGTDTALIYAIWIEYTKI